MISEKIEQLKTRLETILANTSSILSATSWIDWGPMRQYDILLMSHSSCITFNLPVVTSPIVIEQQCHTVTSYNWLQDHDFQYVLGMAFSEDVQGWFFHSFGIKNGVIYEPTPIIRDIYWGRLLTEEEASLLVPEELNNIAKLQTDNLLPSEIFFDRIL